MRLLFLSLSLSVLLSSVLPAQSPRSSDYHTMTPWGSMTGTITRSQKSGWGEEFGSAIVALGDLNNDSIADWGVKRLRVDTTFNGKTPVEWLVYHGVKGGLPTVESGQRIGPVEIGSETSLLCAGDFDHDGNSDLVASLRVFGDTSNGNTSAAYPLYHCVVFWGQSSGQFTLADTTRLSCGAQTWSGPDAALNVRWTTGTTENLIIASWEGAGITQATVVRVPRVYIFTGRPGQRWGRGAIAHTADWTWWNTPSASKLQLVDQDCDGQYDVALIGDARTGTGGVSVLYGRSQQLPDTADTETITLERANGHYSLFRDVTGDGTVELITNSGSEERIKIYAGRPSQRLKDQYGSGIDEPIEGKGWWHRPWAEIWLPNRIHDGWFKGGFEPIYDLGDGNGDGIGDIWANSWPFLLCYTGGQFMDSLIDGEFDTRPATTIWSAVRLGDVDGSGIQSFAVGHDQVPHATPDPFPGRVEFFKPDSRIPAFGFDPRRLPPMPGEQCTASTGIEDQPAHNSLTITASPNPAKEEVLLQWKASHAQSIVIITDAVGQEITRFTLEPGQAQTVWPTTGIAPGVYFIRIQTDVRVSTLQIVLQ